MIQNKKIYKKTNRTEKKPRVVKKRPSSVIGGKKPLYPMRINKYIAHMGIASRREADELIEKGKIYVNGVKAELGTQVKKSDIVGLGKDGTIKRETLRYFAYYKARGITTTKEENSQDILKVTTFPVRVFPVGRLDKDSEGLIIMTNDGRVTERLLHPRFYHEKEYRAELDHAINNTLLRGLKSGLHVGAFKARPAQVRKYDEHTIDIILTEGQNRQVRRMVKAFGYNVRSLVRFRIENIELGDMQSGETRELLGEERAEFLKRLGIV